MDDFERVVLGLAGLFFACLAYIVFVIVCWRGC
jgi:hypothetical protein